MKEVGIGLKTYERLLATAQDKSQRVKVITDDRCLEGYIYAVEGYAEGVLIVKAMSLAKIFIPISLILTVIFE